MKRITAPRTLSQSPCTSANVKVSSGITSPAAGRWAPCAVPVTRTAGCFHDGDLWPDCRD
jgi:hypothetical protein